MAGSHEIYPSYFYRKVTLKIFIPTLLSKTGIGGGSVGGPNNFT